MSLIDADVLVEFLLKEIIECDKEYDDKSDHIILGAGQEAELIRDKVKEMPTVDIVRCKDCKHWFYFWESEKHHCTESEKHLWGCPIREEDDFCSRGEKKDDI